MKKELKVLNHNLACGYIKDFEINKTNCSVLFNDDTSGESQTGSNQYIVRVETGNGEGILLDLHNEPIKGSWHDICMVKNDKTRKEYFKKRANEALVSFQDAASKGDTKGKTYWLSQIGIWNNK